MNKTIEVFSTVGCGKCRLLKEWLKIKDIDYVERNITYDEEAVQLIREAELKSLPQVRIDGEFVTFKQYNDLLELV